MLERLVNAGAKVEDVDTENITAIFVATQYGELDCLVELIRLAGGKREVL